MTKQEYLLTCLSEESSEITQMVSKNLRFGPHEVYPGTSKTNLEHLSCEIMDLLVVFKELRKLLPIPPIDNEAYLKYREAKLEAFLNLARERGRIK